MFTISSRRFAILKNEPTNVITSGFRGKYINLN